MGLGNLFSATDIAGSGLTAERMRMEVASNNIANAHSTRSVGGGAYRRQQVLFSAVMDQALGTSMAGGNGNLPSLGGVHVSGIVNDETPLEKVFNPSHPDANDEGYVEMPNVKLPTEMIDLMTASRAYEANIKSLQTFRQMTEQALALMRANV
ncbi:flagellar basal body rod protein FlgC [Planctomicrobium piriforme]|uniref:Flagellar basal-body rod protein FlgC n=1 Tax=Planctomicrobium piriforme TaxID=1576369 RepID=A0A1I3GR97_9PLAN|nr:flagellar basal body rod protein FlgC [Planctomicrobium piriforme]SFI25924.1 flagellar basal-body rod protein FlgC [Planctomicrobium piriforme]